MNAISMNFYGEGGSKNWLEWKKRKLERPLPESEPNRGGNKVSIARTVPPFENTFGRLTLHPATRVERTSANNADETLHVVL